jgi:hypothetical protein
MVFAATALAILVIPAPATTATAAVRAATRYFGASPNNSDAVKWATAFCPPGTKIVGGGAHVSTETGEGQVHLTGYAPHDDVPTLGDYMIAFAEEDETGYAGSWSVTAHAMCMSSAFLTGWEIVSLTGTGGSGSTQAVAVTCPAGKDAVGIGATVAGNGPGQVFLTGVFPSVGLRGTNATAAEDQTGYAGGWTVTAYAICLPSSEQLYEVHAATPGFAVAGRGSHGMRLACPIGTTIRGVGAQLVGGTGNVNLHDVRPIADTKANIAAEDDEAGWPPTYQTHGYLICQ